MSRQREANPHFHPRRDIPTQRESHDPNLHFPIHPHDQTQLSQPQERPSHPFPSQQPPHAREKKQRSRPRERPNPPFPITPHPHDQNQRSRTQERPNLLFPIEQHPHPHDQSQGSQNPQERHSQPFSTQRPHDSTQHRHQHGLMVPPPRKTNPMAWFLAVFCALFWLIIIIGGLVILVVYLLFRPRSPKFDVSSASLNAAYLDMGYLLNSDLTLLANFSNPNKKVKIDFNSIIIDLYHERNLLATSYIEPFSTIKKSSMFANVHMVTSQVPLSVAHSQRLRKQMESNRVIFEIKGLFRTRSNLGSFLRYSYWLYGHCTIVVTGPPGGVMVAKRCRTKR